MDQVLLMGRHLQFVDLLAQGAAWCCRAGIVMFSVDIIRHSSTAAALDSFV